MEVPAWLRDCNRIGKTESHKDGGAYGSPVKDPTVSDERKSKPFLDEQTFSKLLEAAYVLQEHNREMQAKNSRVPIGRNQLQSPEEGEPGTLIRDASPGPKSAERLTQPEYGFPLAKIVETQHDIQVRHLELDSALKLVADRVVEITKASGAAIGIMEGKVIRYRAIAGKSAPVAESTDQPNRSLGASCLKSGKAFLCEDVSGEGSIDAETCKTRGIGSLIAAPIFHDGRVVGGIELYYSTSNGFADQDVHTCQLMAGLVTEALARDEEITWKKSLANERAAMLEALEKLQPNLVALTEKPPEKAAPAVVTPAPEAGPYRCRKCGHQLVRDEQFCGQCGTPRASDYEPPSMQSKLASLWQMQESHGKGVVGDGGKGISGRDKVSTESVSKEVPLAHAIHEQVPELAASSDEEPTIAEELSAALLYSKEFAEVENEESPPDLQELSGEESTDEELKPSKSLAETQVTQEAHWSSAASARAFLEKLTPAKHRGTLLRLWNIHRGDIYLAIAVVLVAFVIRWAVWPDHAAKATRGRTAASASHGKSPESDLSLFERMLVQLGLAEPPPVPEDKGNPGVQVWVDLQTALYYCPGADLYGKTPKGKFTTQHAAQLDQFEPAYRKACN